MHCDLADETAVLRLFAQANDAFGHRISCVVNNASLFEQDSVGDCSSKLLDWHMHTNLLAPILLARALHAVTPEGEQSVVINLLDQKLFNMNPDFLSYTISKASLATATTMLAQALAPRLRVVGVAPGISLVSGDQSAADFAIAHTMTPLGRSSTPADIASVVCFVAEAPAITGTTIVVDGGQHLIPLQRDVMFVAK
jgi:NAD(P)-dependent dehydrogenase (short-subunit alcohol dehydrogenase family)